MKVSPKVLVVLVTVALAMGIVAGIAHASQITEGQVFAVADSVLYIRTESNEPVSFSPYWNKQGESSSPAICAKNVLASVESGEMVRVTWTMDEREGRRRIDEIKILSPLEGTTRGVVVSSSVIQMVMKPKDEPGTVTVYPRPVQIENRWTQDPAVAKRLATLRPGAKVTVSWIWDEKGRKRITAITEGW